MTFTLGPYMLAAGQDIWVQYGGGLTRPRSG
jgi:hypothetical protein